MLVFVFMACRKGWLFGLIPLNPLVSPARCRLVWPQPLGTALPQTLAQQSWSKGDAGGVLLWTFLGQRDQPPGTRCPTDCTAPPALPPTGASGDLWTAARMAPRNDTSEPPTPIYEFSSSLSATGFNYLLATKSSFFQPDLGKWHSERDCCVMNH